VICYDMTYQEAAQLAHPGAVIVWHAGVWWDKGGTFMRYHLDGAPHIVYRIYRRADWKAGAS